jgi:hypothetical protein
VGRAVTNDEPGEPSDAEVLGAVKLWADAAGIIFPQVREPLPAGWIAQVWRDHDQVKVWFRGEGESGLGESWDLDVDTVLVWSLAVASGRSVDLGKCPKCKGTGREGEVIGFTDRATAESCAASRRSDGWTTTLAAIADAEFDWALTVIRECRSCNAGRRDVREAARLVLDALPQSGTIDRLPESAAREHMEKLRLGAALSAVVVSLEAEQKLWSYRWEEPGDPTSIEALGVWADAWMEDGDPLGPAVRHWLATLNPGPRVEHFGWRAAAVAGVRAAWRRLTVECMECEGTGRQGPLRDQWPPELLRACTGCMGHGRVKPRPAAEMTAVEREALVRSVAAADSARIAQ